MTDYDEDDGYHYDKLYDKFEQYKKKSILRSEVEKLRDEVIKLFEECRLDIVKQEFETRKLFDKVLKEEK